MFYRDYKFFIQFDIGFTYALDDGSYLEFFSLTFIKTIYTLMKKLFLSDLIMKKK